MEDHNGILIDWGYSVKEGELIKNVCPKYKDFYPKDVYDKKPANFGYDMYMFSNCMLKLLCGNNVKTDIPYPIKGLFKACGLNYKQRESDVGTFYDEFNKVLGALYGPKKFRTFVMPETVNK